MIFRLIAIFVVGAVLVYFILNALIALFRTPIFSKCPRKQIHQGPLVKCKVCQTFIPKNQALQHNNCYYCSEEHRSSDT